MQKKRVGVIGATGYAGVELIRLLLRHPHITIQAVSSVSFEGQTLDTVYPNLLRHCNLPLTDSDTVIEQSDIIFASLPHGLSEELAKKCFHSQKLFIDLGADFRLDAEEEYTAWYGLKYKEKELHRHSVYSIPELHRNRLEDARIIGNPGCYPTSAALGMAPSLHNGLLQLDSIIIDSKSGATGAGRGLALNTHFTECNEAFGPYKTATHRHTPEIQQTLGQIAGREIKVTFVPHLLPINRGIISTMYANLVKEMDLEKIYNLYQDFYKGCPFIRVLALGQTVNVKHVKYSNYCDISLHMDTGTNRLIAVSAIDNMVKGAAGQAIQNMNIVCGYEEDAGINDIPPAF